MNIESIINELSPGEVRSVPGLEAESYHGTAFVSQSLLKDFGSAPSPAHFRAAEPKEPTEAMQLGTVFHSMTLEPMRGGQYWVRPEEYPDAKKDGDKTVMKPWHGAAAWCKNWMATHTDKPVITAEQESSLHAMRDAALAMPVFMGLLTIGQTEVSWFKRDAETGLILKGRTDLIATDSAEVTWICDLKKVRRGGASETEFAKTCVDFGYHFQAAFYLDLTGASRFVFCAVEDAPPFAANLIELDAEAVALGRATYRRHLNAYAECFASGTWPGYAPGIKRVNLPAWAFK